MTPSPVQLLRLVFLHVKVELDTERLPSEIPNPLTTVFTFDKVNIKTEVGFGEDDPDEKGSFFIVELRVIVDNAPAPNIVHQRYAPYTVDVGTKGMILVPSGAEKLDPPRDLALVNGAAMLWSATREQVLSITSRMPAGPLMLPTVHFHDLKKRVAAKSEEPITTFHTRGEN